MSNQEQQTKPDGGASVSTAGLGAWLPIATAPKNGDMVLVNDTTPGFTPWVAASWHDGDEWSGWVYDDGDTADNNPLGPNPTHWLPIPPLPEAPNVELSGPEAALSPEGPARTQG